MSNTNEVIPTKMIFGEFHLTIAKNKISTDETSHDKIFDTQWNDEGVVEHV